MKQREIKFRIWDKVKNQFVFSDPSDLANIVYLDNNGLIDTLDKNFVFQQFTGLKDKNGREIYEGDICEFLWYYYAGSDERPEVKKVIAEVYWDGEFSMFAFDRDKIYALNDLGFGVESLEVKGNIFENPELITKN